MGNADGIDIWLIIAGVLLLLGLFADYIGHKTNLPRVTLIMLLGFMSSQHGLDVLPDWLTAQFENVSTVALLVVGFLLGGQFQLSKLRHDSKAMLWVSASAAMVTIALVTLALSFTSLPVYLCLVIGCIASATAPAPILDVILELKARGPFSRLLMRVVAIDDIWALLFYSLTIAATGFWVNGSSSSGALAHAAWEIFGAMALGILFGYPAAKLTGRIRPGQPTLLEALGLVFICGGTALYLGVSHLITVMTMGAMVVNLARHHSYPFHEIEYIEWPFMMVFFFLAGASLQVTALQSAGWLCAIYVLMRTAGKYLGSWLGASVAGSDIAVKKWMGLAMLPHAGIPIGMALMAAHQFPDFAQTILTVVITATIAFELAGPILVHVALRRARSAPSPPGTGS